MKSSFKLKLKPSKAIPILRSFFKQKFANGSIFFKEKIFPTIKPKKIHKKADEINIFIEDKKWLNKMEKKTRLEIVVAPNMFCLIIFILEYLTQKHSETEN